jgi:hypothetical protein
MNTMRRMLVISLAAAAVASVAWAADANVTGTWTMNVETSAGPGTPTFVLKQSEKNVSGTYSGALGEAPVTGTVNGNEVTLKFTISAPGMELAVTYAGAVEGDTMKGKVSMGELGEGTFTGKKS